MKKENQPAPNVNVPAARLCFVDEAPKDENGKDKPGEYPKGHLDLWEKDTPGYNGFNGSGGGISHYNHKLWEFFKKKHPGSGEITQEIFDSWYNEQSSIRNYYYLNIKNTSNNAEGGGQTEIQKKSEEIKTKLSSYSNPTRLNLSWKSNLEII